MATYDDSGVMQAQLGLVAQGNASPMGLPTPMPQVLHPGDAARNMVQQTQSAAMQTMQTSAMLGAAPGGFGGLAGFSAQYQANMASIRGQQLSPFGAGMASSMMGMGGYAPGMMPSPVQMTPPNMGIYRPMAPPPMMTIPPVHQTPLFPGPFTPHAPPPMFTTTFEQNQRYADMRGQQATAVAMSVPGVAARVGTDIAGSHVGRGLGAALGGALGGVPGAALGSAIGSLGGGLLTDRFLGGGVQHLVDEMNPIARIGRQATQARAISRDFVVSGPSLDISGQGLNRVASHTLARNLNSLAGNTAFQRETGGAFSTQDLMKITQLSGEQGLLNIAQNPEQITNQIKSISKVLKTYMKLAAEPDVAEAIKQMGRMGSMGLSIGEQLMAVERAKAYGRMAGTDVRTIMQQGGLPGAMLFQQQGLSAGLGFNVGMGAVGMARQAATGGTFTPAQLAMLGGQQGLAQNNMEMAAAMLKQPLMAAAMSNFNAGSGGFTLNPAAVAGLSRGQQGIPALATMGVNNMVRAVQQGGIGGLASFQLDQADMQDQLGRAMGPEGLKMMGFQQILNTRKFLGVRGRGGLFAAAKAMGLSDEQARQSVSEMGSPEFFQNMQQQIRMRQQQERADAEEQRQATAPGLLDKASQSYAGVRETRMALGALGFGYDSMSAGVSAYFANYSQESAAAKSGQTVRRIHSSMLAASPLETRMMRNLSMRDVLQGTTMAGYSGRDTAVFRTAGGRAVGQSELLADIRDMGIFGGGSAGDRQAYYSAMGGLKGTLGRGAGLFGMAATGDEIREALPDIQQGAEGTARGLFATTDEQREARSRLASSLGGEGKAMQFQQEMSRLMAGRAKERSSLFGENRVFMGSEYEQMVAEAAKNVGVDPSKVSVADAQAVAVQDAKRLAGAKGAGTFRPVEATGEGGFRAALDKVMEKRDARARGLFGQGTDVGAVANAGAVLGGALGATFSLGTGTLVGAAVGGFAGGAIGSLMAEGDREQREAGMKLLFTGDEDTRVRTLAALQAAATQEGEDSPEAKRYREYQAELQRTDPQKYDELVRRASELVERGEAGKGKGMLAKAGQTLSRQTMGDMTKGMEEGTTEYLRDQTSLIVTKGLEGTFADKSVVAEMGGKNLDETIRRLLNSGKVKGEQMTALSKEYQAAAGNTQKQQAIVEKAAQLAYNAGYATEAEQVGGVAAASDRKAQVQSEAAAGVAAEAMEEFPDAVKSFSEASRELLKAAEKLGQVNTTALPAGTNSGSWFGFGG